MEFLRIVVKEIPVMFVSIFIISAQSDFLFPDTYA